MCLLSINTNRFFLCSFASLLSLSHGDVTVPGSTAEEKRSLPIHVNIEKLRIYPFTGQYRFINRYLFRVFRLFLNDAIKKAEIQWNRDFLMSIQNSTKTGDRISKIQVR